MVQTINARPNAEVFRAVDEMLDAARQGVVKSQEVLREPGLLSDAKEVSAGAEQRRPAAEVFREQSEAELQGQIEAFLENASAEEKHFLYEVLFHRQMTFCDPDASSSNTVASAMEDLLYGAGRGGTILMRVPEKCAGDVQIYLDWAARAKGSARKSNSDLFRLVMNLLMTNPWFEGFLTQLNLAACATGINEAAPEANGGDGSEKSQADPAVPQHAIRVASARTSAKR